MIIPKAGTLFISFSYVKALEDQVPIAANQAPEPNERADAVEPNAQLVNGVLVGGGHTAPHSTGVAV
jgi:hypothetical protein